MKKRRKRKRPRDEAAYTCPTCGEQIVIPVDRTGGEDQEYVEDCPVCCNPNVIHVEFFGEDEPPRVWAEGDDRKECHIDGRLPIHETLPFLMERVPVVGTLAAESATKIGARHESGS
jgi:hypothetical protein